MSEHYLIFMHVDICFFAYVDDFLLCAENTGIVSSLHEVVGFSHSPHLLPIEEQGVLYVLETHDYKL